MTSKKLHKVKSIYTLKTDADSEAKKEDHKTKKTEEEEIRKSTVSHMTNEGHVISRAKKKINNE